VLGDAPAIPKNYYALELNEARINWFNPNANYNQVVTAAADEAGGQGFVTEYAQLTSALRGVAWSTDDEDGWLDIQRQAVTAPQTMVRNALFELSQWDGFWEAFQANVTWPADIDLSDIQDCPSCFASKLVVGDGFVTALETDVIKPARLVQELIDQHPQITRLYSTLSARDMTVDPLFSFNPSLPSVSNVHTATRVIECARGYYESDAPWHIELPQGGVVRGGPTTFGSWPKAFDAQPANRRVLRLGETGSGKVLEDNSESIDASVADYNGSVVRPERHQPIPNEHGAIVVPGTGNFVDANGNPVDANGNPIAASSEGVSASGGGCALTGRSGAGAWLLLLGLLAAVRRRAR
jgi:hypothetical protein